MHGFFDLNIPYADPSPSNKNVRIRLVVKAMELGYSGIAYNRTIKGVMSEKDRCSISPLTLSSLLKLAPSLSSSVEFHRDLLGVPRSSPFRQYTRLTVCVESPSQAQALNSGNPILKTYDLVAVRPLNQNSFDQACEKLEVDIIAIDFSEKLPFRLKQPMVRAAIERGVYFEMTYSNIIADLQARRQMISNAKLLVDWTRGKNLIFSSAAPSVNELRGPYDVSNLSSLLGLSTERAKASISKNCSTLIANALRKKQFYKEAVKVEVIASSEKFDMKDPWSGDKLNKWDPISSGEGDLLLDDMAKSFITSSKVSKPMKAIDFASAIDSISAPGFQVNDLIFGPGALTQSVNSHKSLSLTAIIEPEPLDRQPEPVRSSICNDPSKHSSADRENSPMLTSSFDSASVSTDPIEVKASEDRLIIPDTSVEQKTNEVKASEDKLVSRSPMEEKTNELDVDSMLIGTDMDDWKLENCRSCRELNIPSTNDNESPRISNMDIGLDAACDDDDDGKLTKPTLPENTDFVCIENIECKDLRIFDIDLSAENVAMDEITTGVVLETREVITDVVLENREYMSSALEDGSMDETLLAEQLKKSREEVVIPTNQLKDLIEVKDGFAVLNVESPEVIMKEQNHEEVDPLINHPTLVPSISGNLRTKRRTPHRTMLFPFKRLVHPITFKKKAQKTKSHFKM